MQINIHARHFDMSDSIKQYVEDHLPPAIVKYFSNIDNAEVTFSKNSHRFDVEIMMHLGKRMDMVTHGQAHDVYAAFDEALEHAAKKIRRHKRRLIDHHQQHLEKEALQASYYVIETDYDNEPDDTDEVDINDIMVDEKQGSPTIIAEEATDIKTLDVASAVMKLDLSSRNALLFKNSTNGKVSLVYVRPDGNIGWVEPQAG